MTSTLNRRHVIVATAALATLPVRLLASDEEAAAAEAQTIEVAMLNKHPEDSKQRMVFLPRVISLNPGDTVTFVPTDKGHNSAIIDDMMPEGAEGWDGKINEEISITFDKPGFYGYKCTPHASVGMFGLIVVEGEGKLDNLEAAQAVKHRGKGRKVWEDIWKEAEEAGLLEASTA